jgi:hypothetical protein
MPEAADDEYEREGAAELTDRSDGEPEVDVVGVTTEE